MARRKTITIKEVARVANVSVTTVSRYLNGQLSKMSAETQHRIQQVIQELNYRPSAAAKNMRTQRTHVIGVIVGDISNVFGAMLFNGMYKALQPEGYSVMMLNANNDPDEEERCVDRLLQQDVDGLIIHPSRSSFESYHPIISAKTPLIFVDRYVTATPPSVTHVTTNNTEASRDMCQELHDQGYQRLILISRTTVPGSAQKPRIRAIQDTATTLGLTVYELDIHGHDTAWLANQIVAHSIGDKHTAVVSLMGPLLFPTLDALQLAGLQFPQQIGLISFDDWNWARYAGNGGIDLIMQNPERIGYEAGMRMLQAIQAEQVRQDHEARTGMDTKANDAATDAASNEVIIPAVRVHGNSL